MAKAFTQLKSPKLGLLDKLTFGKLKDCRLCDVIQDHYEYLIWAEKQGFVKFDEEATTIILEQAHYKRWMDPIEVEEKPFASHRISSWFSDPWDEDIPF